MRTKASLPLLALLFISSESTASPCLKIEEYEVAKGKVAFVTRHFMDPKRVAKPLDDVDVLSFQELTQPRPPNDSHTGVAKGCKKLYAKDKSSVYFRGTVIPEAKPSDFTVLEGGYAKSGKTYFWENKVIPQADPGSFVVTGNDRAKDQNRTYAKEKADSSPRN